MKDSNLLSAVSGATLLGLTGYAPPAAAQDYESPPLSYFRVTANGICTANSNRSGPVVVAMVDNEDSPAGEVRFPYYQLAVMPWFDRSGDSGYGEEVRGVTESPAPPRHVDIELLDQLREDAQLARSGCLATPISQPPAAHGRKPHPSLAISSIDGSRTGACVIRFKDSNAVVTVQKDAMVQQRETGAFIHVLGGTVTFQGFQSVRDVAVPPVGDTSALPDKAVKYALKAREACTDPQFEPGRLQTRPDGSWSYTFTRRTTLDNVPR